MTQGGTTPSEVLGQIEEIVSSALQDTRAHLLINRANNADMVGASPGIGTANAMIMRMQAYLLGIKDVLDAAKDKAGETRPRNMDRNAIMDIPKHGVNNTNNTMHREKRNEAHSSVSPVPAKLDAGQGSTTKEQLSKLNQDRRPQETRPADNTSTGSKLDISSAQAQRNAPPARSERIPSWHSDHTSHSTADIVDTGEMRLRQMSSIEKKIMDFDRNESLNELGSTTANLSSLSSFATVRAAPRIADALAVIPAKADTQRLQPVLLSGEKPDKELMQKWTEIFRHRTRPQHPDSTAISLLPPMDHVQLPSSPISVKEQHKNRERTLVGPRPNTVFVVTSFPSSFQDSYRKQEPARQEQARESSPVARHTPQQQHQPNVTRHSTPQQQHQPKQSSVQHPQYAGYSVQGSRNTGTPPAPQAPQGGYNMYNHDRRYVPSTNQHSSGNGKTVDTRASVVTSSSNQYSSARGSYNGNMPTQTYASPKYGSGSSNYGGSGGLAYGLHPPGAGYSGSGYGAASGYAPATGATGYAPRGQGSMWYGR